MARLLHICITLLQWVNTPKFRQNGCQLADSIFKFIFFNENCCILIQISLKCIPNGPTDSKPSLFQIMAHYQNQQWLCLVIYIYICGVCPHVLKVYLTTTHVDRPNKPTEHQTNRGTFVLMSFFDVIFICRDNRHVCNNWHKLYDDEFHCHMVVRLSASHIFIKELMSRGL